MSRHQHTGGMPDYLKLFMRREGKVVLGRHLSNVALLTLVLTATFFAIAFANGSLNYLNYKMNDPFIKWVDIKNDNNPSAFERLRGAMSADESMAETYHYGSYSYDYEYSYNFFGRDQEERHYLKCRFFDAGNKDLVRAILASDNRILGMDPGQVDDMDNGSIGVFLTEKAARKLGYTDSHDNIEIPAYIGLYRYSPGAWTLGFKTVEDRVSVPLPVMGVVRRLPGSVDVVAFTNLYRQIQDPLAFYMFNEAYASSLCYFVPEGVDEWEFDAFLGDAIRAVSDAPFYIESDNYDPRTMYSYKNRVTEVDEDGFTYHYLGFRRVAYSDSTVLSPMEASKVAAAVDAEYAAKGVQRIFDYDYTYDQLPVGDYLSIHFNDLSEIRRFAEEVVERNELEIEMSQINAKENFQSVSVMAITLSVVMVIFAIVCILLFIVNLLRSYFQKVKRNIGTFKAFGISNGELEKVYMTIMLALVVAALLISLVICTLAQLLLPLLGISKGEGFGYLSLWSCDIITAFPPLITIGAVLVVVVSAAITVRAVMRALLSATPGDLIYDR